MTWEATAEVDEFEEAAAWFRSRMPVTQALADELAGYAGPRAFTIAGVAQLDIVEQVHTSLLRAIETGIPFEEWKREIEDSLTSAWGSPNAHRIETIFRNATSQAHNAGRWRQMNHPAVKGLRPFLFFDGVIDSRTTEICKAWDGTIRPVDDPVWQTASPQMHHRCRSQLRSMTEAEARRRGVTETLPEAEAAPGFGSIPTESEWKPDGSTYPRELFAEYEAKRSDIARSASRPRLDEG